MEVATTVSQEEVLVPRYSHTKSVHHFKAKLLSCADNSLIPLSSFALSFLKTYATC